MPRTLAEPLRALGVTQIPNRVQTNVCLYDGAALNVDYGSYLTQHDVVYLAPPRDGSQGMPIGDGDLGAMVWCPDRLQFQVQKSDLWSDPPDDGEAFDWRQLSAGTVSLSSDPSFLHNPERFEQRLSLHSGVVTIRSDNAQGACQITAFVSATAGVLAVRYRDQCVRTVERRVDIDLRRGAHLFAIGETAGVLQAFRDRRYALLARIGGCPARAAHSRGRCGLILEATRSSDFTLYVAVATSPRNGDPVAMAGSRLQAAIAQGFDRLLAEQKQHWGQFWEKSFLRLTSATGDTLPSYLENLWYMGLYQQAACSRGYDAPLANGGLWLGGEDSRDGPAVYAGSDLRAMLAGLISSNHLELSVPYVDTYYRMLPALAARTGSETGLAGARFPARFNRFGADLSPDLDHEKRERTEKGEWLNRIGNELSGDAAAHVSGSVPAQACNRLGMAPPPIARSVDGRARAAAHQELSEGLDTGLLIFEAWRRAPDPFFLRERAYPLLRAGTVFAVERCQTTPELWGDAAIRSRIATALRALLWASEEFGVEEELRAEWIRLAAGLDSAEPHGIPELQPFGALKPSDSAAVFASLIESLPQQPCGIFGETLSSPDLAFSARLCAGLSAMLLAERALPASALTAKPAHSAPIEYGGATPSGSAASKAREIAHTPTVGFGGAAPSAIQVFAGLPESWGGAFSFIAPGGFRVSAEAAQGHACYVAVKSLLGGVFRLVNPWGRGTAARILRGHASLRESAAAVLEFPTEPNTAYLIERSDMSFAQAATVRLIGKANAAPRSSGASAIGIPAVQGRPATRKSRMPPCRAVVSVVSRVERARLRLRE